MFLWWIPWLTFYSLSTVTFLPTFGTSVPLSSALFLKEGVWRRFPTEDGDASPRILREIAQNFRKRSINEFHPLRPLTQTSERSTNGVHMLASSLSMRSLERALEERENTLAGMGGSAIQSIGASGGQRFATEPAPQTAVIGSTAVLPCRVMGKVGHLQWTKDGFGLGTDRDLFGFARYSMIGSDDEGDFSLRMHPVLLEDDALYQCQVSASDGVPGIRSQPVRLTVYVPPDPPKVEPEVLKTTAGMSVQLECESRGGRPAPEIQWVDDSKREPIQLGAIDSIKPMADGKRTIVKSTLTFTPKRHHNNQTITCLTSNQALSSPLTASIKLEVFFPPEVILTSHPEQFVEGDDATFYCDSVSNPQRVTYRWFHNTQRIANETSRNLKLSKMSRDLHQDSLSCEVSNKVGTSKKTQTVYVRYGPTFRSLPKDVMAEVGADVDLTCNVDSNPSASIVWLREDSDKIIGSGATYRVKVAASTAGVYKCIASVRGRDFEFPNIEGRARVLVKGPPQIVSDSEQQGRKGDTVSLECSTVSVPSPIRVTWTYKGKQIDLNDPRYAVVEDEGEEGLRNVLVIHDADSDDFGDYNCSVVNEYGVARKLIRLKEEKRVPILLVVGCAVGVVLVAVIAVSLVFCNKRHKPAKGSSDGAKEKSGGTGDRSNTVVANMYSAPSETKLDEDTLCSPSYQRTFNDVKVSPIGSNRTFAEGANPPSYTMKPLNGESRGGPSVRENFESDYSAFIESAAADVRRSSLTDISIYSPPTILGQTITATAAAPEFCTIRRNPSRATDPMRSNANNASIHPVFPSPHPNGSVGTATSGSLRPMNGSIQPTVNRHSTYIPQNSSTCSPPPPPPYHRSSSNLPHDGVVSPKPSIRQKFTEPSLSEAPTTEAKYIFSPEAMLKPGTLV